MQEETEEWIFINRIPLLCEKNHIMRQQKVETWLDLYQLKRELDTAQAELPKTPPLREYIS